MTAAEIGEPLLTLGADLLAVVIDPGSDTVKAGLNTDDYPRVVMQDIGPDRKRRNSFTKNNNRRDGKKGKADSRVTDKTVQEPEAAIVYKHPIEMGLVVDWDIMEEVYRHMFYDKLKLEPKDHQVLVTEVPLNPKYLRERLTQLMFEKFQVSGFYLKDTSSLSLFHTGRTTGTVLSSGESVTTTAVVVDGHVLRGTIPKTFYAGGEFTYYLKQLLSMKGHTSEWLEHGHVLRDLKEKYCFVSENFEYDFRNSRNGHGFESQYTLPDGSTLNVNEERFLCPEALFNPQMFDCSCVGIQHQLHRSIQFAETKHSNIINTLWSNVVISGGNSLFPGLAHRLSKEVNKLCKTDTNVKVVARDDRHHAAWIGGTLYSLMDTSEWISKQDYDEYGPKIVNKKCF